MNSEDSTDYAKDDCDWKRHQSIDNNVSILASGVSFPVRRIPWCPKEKTISDIRASYSKLGTKQMANMSVREQDNAH